MTSSTSWWADSYPNQYYACVLPQYQYRGYPSIGYFDAAAYTAAPAWLVSSLHVIPLTKSEWDARPIGGVVYKDGSIQVLDGVTLTLQQNATNLLASQKSYVTEEYLVYGLAVPTGWSVYLQQLKAISDGTDTTSTTLPLSPTEQAAQALTPAQQVQKALLALGALLEEKQALGIYFTPTGTTIPLLFSTSAHAQDQYNGANTLAKENPDTPQNFITESGAPVTLSASDVIAVTNKAANYINQTNAVYSTLFAKVEADPTTDITVGWPANT